MKTETAKEWIQKHCGIHLDLMVATLEARDKAIQSDAQNDLLAQIEKLRGALELCVKDIKFWNEILDKEWKNFDGQLNHALNNAEHALTTSTIPKMVRVEELKDIAEWLESNYINQCSLAVSHPHLVDVKKLDWQRDKLTRLKSLIGGDDVKKEMA